MSAPQKLPPVSGSPTQVLDMKMKRRNFGIFGDKPVNNHTNEKSCWELSIDMVIRYK